MLKALGFLICFFRGRHDWDRKSRHVSHCFACGYVIDTTPGREKPTDYWHMEDHGNPFGTRWRETRAILIACALLFAVLSLAAWQVGLLAVLVVGGRHLVKRVLQAVFELVERRAAARR